MEDVVKMLKSASQIQRAETEGEGIPSTGRVVRGVALPPRGPSRQPARAVSIHRVVATLPGSFSILGFPTCI